MSDDPLDKIIASGALGPPSSDWAWYRAEAEMAPEEMREKRVYAISPATILAVDAELVALRRFKREHDRGAE